MLPLAFALTAALAAPTGPTEVPPATPADAEAAPAPAPREPADAAAAPVRGISPAAQAASDALRLGLLLTPSGRLRYRLDGTGESHGAVVEAVDGDQLLVSFSGGEHLRQVPRAVLSGLPLLEEETPTYALLPGAFALDPDLGPTAWSLPVRFHDARPHLALNAGSAAWVQRARRGRDLTIAGIVISALSFAALPIAATTDPWSASFPIALTTVGAGLAAGAAMVGVGAARVRQGERGAFSLYVSPGVEGASMGASGAF